MSAADSDRTPLPESTGASVDADNPWLGLASFTEESQAYFFGREGEVAELTRRVQRKLLTVLFGKSGLGKTSILKAGLVPGLRAQGYFPVYLRIDYGHDSPEPAEQIKQAINKAAAGQGTAHAMPAPAAPTIDPTESIWEFLHHREAVQDSGAEVPAETRTVKSAATPPITHIPLLIFDQFEELFTLAQSDEFGRARAARFVEELADLVENRAPKALEAKLDTDDSIAERFDFARSDYRVVIALREDYLAPLESLKKQMPSLSQNRLRLAPMTGNQALEAVLLPGNRLRPGKPLVSDEVAEAIVRFVAGGAELQNAEVEPSLLSLICRELNEQRIARGRSEISLDLLAGSHESILTSFYERSLADQPASVRRIIEDELLTESGYRENLAEESLLKRFQATGAAPDALTKLVNRRLLRIEERLDVRRVELTHDVLTGVVKASRDQRHEREAREATERLLAEQAARASAARRGLRRARAIAAGCTLLALVAIAAAVAAVFSVQRARQAEQVARQTRAISEQAREEAEGLLGFLTDDFVSELETFGRYQTIAELSQREIDYFQHLPPQLADPRTVRSGALAFVNHALALQFLGDVDTADTNLTQALALLEHTDRSEATAIAMGRAYTEQAFDFSAEANTAKANVAAERAVDLLRPIAHGAGASIEARVAYLEALVELGYTDLNTDQKAVRVEQEALQIGRSLGAPDHATVTVDADYAVAGGYLATALARLGRDPEALRASQEALAVIDHVLELHPQFGWALFGKQQAMESLVFIARNELDAAGALRFAMQEEQTSLALVSVEPKNGFYVFLLGFASTDLSHSLWNEGRLRESIAYTRKAVDAYHRVITSGLRPVSVAYQVGTMDYLVRHQTQLGDFAGAAATIGETDALLSSNANLKLGVTSGPSDRLDTANEAERTSLSATLAYERGDLAAAKHLADAAVAAVQRLQTGGSDPSAYDLAGQVEYALGDFAAAVEYERTALKAEQAVAGGGTDDQHDKQRDEGRMGVWLSMALSREGKRQEAAQTIGPVVQLYRVLEKKNRGDQWLPLELAEALYAQSLTDDAHRAQLLREAAQRMDHLVPAIAALHDTRVWRARIGGCVALRQTAKCRDSGSFKMRVQPMA